MRKLYRVVPYTRITTKQDRLLLLPYSLITVCFRFYLNFNDPYPTKHARVKRNTKLYNTTRICGNVNVQPLQHTS